MRPVMHTRIGELVLKYLTGELSADEHVELDEFNARSEQNKKLFDELTDPEHLMDGLEQMRKWDVEAAWKKIEADFPDTSISLWKKVAVAAAVVIVVAGWYLLQKPEVSKRPQLAQVNTSTSLYKAMLKRSNGRVIKLNEIANGEVDNIASLPLMKNDSQLLYPHTPVVADAKADTVETPGNAYFQIRLPDGSMVWLNCTSSICFPVSFSEHERNVAMDGEAFFEVVKDLSKPFRVKAPEVEVQATGTRFNIKAYKEDSVVRTTLYEGAVKVSSGKDITYLVPGEQAILRKGKKIKKVKDAGEVNKALAWKQNSFYFEHDDLKTIMAELARWYGYDVEYKKEIPSKTYNAILFRSTPLKDILEYFSKLTQYKIKAEGKKIIVEP